MAYVEDLQSQYILTPPVGSDLGLPFNRAYSSYFPNYEVTTPSYVVPNAYATAQASFRSNEFAYSLTNRRATAISNAQLKLYDLSDPKIPKEVIKSPVMDFMENLNELLMEPSFWAISEVCRCIAGFSAWEIEKNNMGEPLHLWYMNPAYCSFLRGDQQVFRAIRYQPYGMPPMDIPAERILLFHGPENFDPLYPFLRWLSPSMLCFPQLRVDTAMTLFLQDFIQHGARVNGLLSVTQTLDDNSAKEIRDRWIKQHGGTGNWTAPAVMGEGAKWEPMQMNFSDMTFPTLDARTETRMCDAFQVPTIVADARAGLDVSSYNNVVEAHKNWHYKWVIPTWKLYAKQIAEKILPMFEIDKKKYSLQFDRRDVYELKEDVVKINTMWINAAKNNLIYRDQFLSLIGSEPVDNKPVYIGEIIRENIQAAAPETMGPASTPSEEFKPKESDVLLTPQQQGTRETGLAAPGGKPTTEAPVKPAGAKPVVNAASTTARGPAPQSHVDDILGGAQRKSFSEEDKLEEKKAFMKFAKNRVKEGKRTEVFGFEFKFHEQEEIDLLLKPFEDPGAAEVMDALIRATNILERSLNV